MTHFQDLLSCTHHHEVVNASFVTFNVNRLGVPRGKKRAPETPEAAQQRRAIGDAIKAADGDVVGLQEVCTAGSLERFLSEQELQEAYPHRAFFKTNDPGGAHLALLSRHPITATQSHREKGLVRDVAEAEVAIGPYPTRVYMVHLKADPFYANNPTPEQMAKAEQTRLKEQAITSQVVAEDLPGMPSNHYVVLGDINDKGDSATAEAFLSDPIVALRDPHKDLTGDEALSHPPSGRRMDVIYLSPELHQKVMPGSAVVLPQAEGGSDHRAVKVTLSYS